MGFIGRERRSPLRGRRVGRLFEGFVQAWDVNCMAEVVSRM